MFTTLLQITNRENQHSAELDIEIMKIGRICGPWQAPYSDRAEKKKTLRNHIKQCLCTLIEVGSQAKTSIVC